MPAGRVKLKARQLVHSCPGVFKQLLSHSLAHPHLCTPDAFLSHVHAHGVRTHVLCSIAHLQAM